MKTTNKQTNKQTKTKLHFLGFFTKRQGLKTTLLQLNLFSNFFPEFSIELWSVFYLLSSNIQGFFLGGLGVPPSSENFANPPPPPI